MKRLRLLIEEWLPAAALGVECIRERSTGQQPPDKHNHGGIALLTPEALHYGRADEVIRPRQEILSRAYQRNPERFVRTHPKPPAQPTAVWINPPATSQASEGELH
jgi:putative transposase